MKKRGGAAVRGKANVGHVCKGTAVSPVGYKYKAQLKELDHRSQGQQLLVPVEARGIVMPLIWQAWERGLERHPDRWWAEYLVKGDSIWDARGSRVS